MTNNHNSDKQPGWLTANQNYYPVLKEDREKLKRKMTPFEIILWEELKGKKLGFKFRRQHVIDCFIVDFVCLKLSLIIEIDGGIHKQQIEYDRMREERLKILGYFIIRFTNEEVDNDIEFVIVKIRKYLNRLNKSNR